MLKFLFKGLPISAQETAIEIGEFEELEANLQATQVQRIQKTSVIPLFVTIPIIHETLGFVKRCAENTRE